MKYIINISLILILGTQVVAQTTSKKTPISIGYFGHLAYQPGMKIGAQFDLKSWKKGSEEAAITKSFYVSPQIGLYTYPTVHTSYLANADFGYKRVKSRSQKYWAFSIGLGFLNQSQITERRVNLNDGSKEKTRENWAWFLPTLNYEFGKSINEKIGWYGKLSSGLKMASTRETSMVLFTEIGLKFNLFSK